MDAAKRARGYVPGSVVLGVVAALLVWVLADGGGSGQSSVAALGTVAVIVALLIVIAWSRGSLALPRLDRAGVVAAATAAGVVIWLGVSIWWSIAGDRSLDAVGKGVAVLAFGVVGLAAGALPGNRLRAVALLVASVIAGTLAWALLGKAIPSLGPDDVSGVSRLKGSIGYWNALSLLADAALGLGLWLLYVERVRFARLVGALLLYLAGLVVLLTQSRTGLLAGIAVVAFGVWQARNRVEVALFGLLALAPATVVAGWAFTRPALVEDGALRADRVADGRLFGLAALAAAVLVVVLVTRVPVERLVATRRRQVVRSLVGAVALVVVVGAIGLVASVGNPFTWAADQLTSSSEVANGPGRLPSFDTNKRTVWWGEAWQIFSLHPAGGTGARTFEIARKRVRDNAQNVTQPHSVPMQLLSDTGVPGFLLGVIFAAAVVAGLRATLRRLDGDERAAAVGLVGLPLAFGLHTLVDYDLDYLAVVAPTGLVIAALLAAGRPKLPPRGGAWGTVITAASAAAAIWIVLAPALSNRAVDRAIRQVDANQLDAAASSARWAQRLNPLSPEPLITRATVAGAAGKTKDADTLYLEATRLQPENPDTWFQLAIFRFVAGDLCGAYYAFNAAYTLDPKSSLFYEGSDFDRAKAAVNDQKNPACGR